MFQFVKLGTNIKIKEYETWNFKSTDRARYWRCCRSCCRLFNGSWKLAEEFDHAVSKVKEEVKDVYSKAKNKAENVKEHVTEDVNHVAEKVAGKTATETK